MITDLDIKKIVSLLHKDYHGCPIHIVQDENSFVEKRQLTPLEANERYKACQDKYIHGTYFPNVEEVEIYPFVSLKQGGKILIAIVVFHELRHFYQDKKNKLNRKYEVKLEKDCNLFAYRMFDRHYDDLVEFLGEV